MSDQNIDTKFLTEKLSNNLNNLEKIVTDKFLQLKNENSNLKENVENLKAEKEGILSATEIVLFEIKSDLEKLKKIIQK